MEEEITIGGKFSDLIIEEGASYIIGGPSAVGKGTISSKSPLRSKRTSPILEVKEEAKVTTPKEPTPKSKSEEPIAKVTTPKSKSEEPIAKVTTPKSKSKSEEPIAKVTTPKSKSKSEEPIAKVTTPKSKSKEPISKVVTPKSKSKEPEPEEEEEKEEEDLYFNTLTLTDQNRVSNGMKYGNIYDIIPSETVDKLCKEYKISPYWLSKYLHTKEDQTFRILESNDFKEYKNKYPVTKWVPAMFDLRKYKGTISTLIGADLPEANNPSVVRPSKSTSSSYELDTGHREYFRRYLNSGLITKSGYRKENLVDDLFPTNTDYSMIREKLGNRDNKSIDLFEGSSEDLEEILRSEEILFENEQYDPAFYKAYICLLLHKHSGGLGTEQSAHPVSQEFIDYITYFHTLSPMDYIYLGEKLIGRPLDRKRFFALLSRGFDHSNYEEFWLSDNDHQRLISNYLSDHDYDDYAYSKNLKIADILLKLDIPSLMKYTPYGSDKEFLIKNLRNILSENYKTIFRDKVDGKDYKFYIKSKDLPTLNEMWLSMKDTDRVYLSNVPPKCKDKDFTKSSYSTIRIGTKTNYECFSLDKLNDHLEWDDDKDNLKLKLSYTSKPLRLDSYLVLDLINTLDLMENMFKDKEVEKNIISKLRQKLIV